MNNILKLIYIIILLIIVYQISIYLCEIIYNDHFNDCTFFMKITFVMLVFFISQIHYTYYTKNHFNIN
jgi:hypothetical protein